MPRKKSLVKRKPGRPRKVRLDPNIPAPETGVIRRPYNRIPQEYWEEIKLAYVAGTPASTLADQYGTSVNNIWTRAWTENWPTPSKILKAASKAREKRLRASGATEIAAAAWEKKLEDHKHLAFELAHKALKKAKRKPIEAKDWADLERADKMARRAAGIEDDKPVNNTFVNLAALVEADLSKDVVDVGGTENGGTTVVDGEIVD